MSSNADRPPRIERRESRLEIRGVTYCVHEWGNPQSPTFVYLHGWGDTASTFQFVVDSLAGEWHIVAPDWRGFGDSRGNVCSYWFPDYLADLDRLLDWLSPGQPLPLVGHSMGANIAGLYAGSFPERVSAFVNIEGFGMPDSEPAEAPARYRAWIEQSRSPASFSDYADFAALASRVRKRSPRMSASNARFVAECWGKREADGRVRLRADPLHKLPNPTLYRRAEAEACWRSIAAPVLLVCGSDSEFAELSYPTASAVEIDLAGHMLHFEAPEALARAIETFLVTTL